MKKILIATAAIASTLIPGCASQPGSMDLCDELTFLKTAYILGCAPHPFREFVGAHHAAVKSAPPTPVADCSTLDDDIDGINNCTDKCPNTLKGAHVNSFGCWTVDVKFDNDKSDINPQYYPELDNVIAVIKDNPDIHIEVQGHTSNTGSADHNQILSERRATAVKDYLSGSAYAKRTLTARGYGFTQPIDTNETETGRTNNRRVQLEVLK
ncbi:MAG: OmpA family protein [Methylobacter sp.]|nr:OmpA family protein [Methylobacter sp.]